MTKYHSKKCEYEGITFDSKREMNYYIFLKDLQDKGEITELDRQIPYELIPKQIDPITHKVIERACSYIADFKYQDKEGKTHVVDTKGFRTPDYIIKRKLLLQRYGIRIEEM